MSKRDAESVTNAVGKRPKPKSENDATVDDADDSNDCTVIPPNDNESNAILIKSDRDDLETARQNAATTSTVVKNETQRYTTCSCLRPNCIFCIPEKMRKIMFKMYNGYPLIDPPSKMYANIASITNVPAVLVTRIFNLHNRSLNRTSKKKPFGELDEVTQKKKLIPLEIADIRRQLLDTKPHNQQNVLLLLWRMYRRNVTVVDFLAAVLDSGNITYRKMCHRLTKRESLILLESQSLRLKRLRFITQIQVYRTESRPIIYVHQLNPVDSSVKTMIFLAATAEGPIATAYLKNTNTKTFTKWLAQNVLNQVTSPAIVVLTEPIAFQEMKASPALTDSKASMIEWLKNENIPFEEDLFKIELYDLIQQTIRQRDAKTPFQLDTEIKQMGHDVLYIPKENCDLNPLEFVLMTIKLKTMAKTDGRFDLNTELHSVGIIKWTECFHRAILYEITYLGIDAKFGATKKNYHIDNNNVANHEENDFSSKYTMDVTVG